MNWRWRSTSNGISLISAQNKLLLSVKLVYDLVLDHKQFLEVKRARCSSVVRAFAHGVMGRRIDPSWGGPIELFLIPAMLWCNKGRGMSNPVCGMVHIKEPLLLIGKSSLCGSSGFPFSLSEWSLTICLMPYNCK